MHQLLHLPDNVKDMGPLFTFSCFDHEDTNGKLAKMVHSRACMDSQILSSFSTLPRLWELSSKYVDPCDDNYETISSLIDSKSTTSAHNCIGRNDCVIIGACVEVNVDNNMFRLLQTVIDPVPITLSKFGRLMVQNIMFHSVLYRRPTKRIDYVIIHKQNNEQKYGIVKYYCALARLQFAILEELIPSTVQLAADSVTGASVSHIIPCIPPTSNPCQLSIIPVHSIMSKVVYICLPNVDCVYVAFFLNVVECD